MHRALSLSAIAVVLATSTAAFADPPNPSARTTSDQCRQGYSETTQGRDQSVAFCDDPLGADGAGPLGAIIPVRGNAARTTLIRPRTTFVPEMLKSVEKM
jgi:hypothetical protein